MQAATGNRNEGSSASYCSYVLLFSASFTLNLLGLCTLNYIFLIGPSMTRHARGYVALV